jgi:hypothetical protein
VCNLYALTKGQDTIRQLSKAMRDTVGNLPIMPGIFPIPPLPSCARPRMACGNSR